MRQKLHPLVLLLALIPAALLSLGNVRAMPSHGAGGSSCAELLVDGGFEAGGHDWTQNSAGGQSLVSDFHPRSGALAAYLGGESNADDRLSQSLVLPAAPASISFNAWWAIATEEPGVAFDRMTVTLHAPDGRLLAELATIASSAAVNTWDELTADLSAYAGQQVVLRFWATTDDNNTTDFYVDDVSIVACAEASTPSPTATPTAVTPAPSATPTPTVTFRPTATATPTETVMPTVTSRPSRQVYLPVILR